MFCKIFMKKIFFLLFFLSLPFPLFAKEKYILQSTENVLMLSGICSLDVKFALTLVNDGQKSVYSSGTPCKDGEFTFSDDLSQWNIPDGQYTLWVNGDPAEKRITMKKIVIVPALQVATKKENQPPKNTFEQAVSNFGGNLAQMSKSLGVMEENLPQTDYVKDTVKHTLIGFLRITLDTLAQFFGDFTSEESIVRPSEVQVIPDVSTPVIPDDTATQAVPEDSTNAVQSTDGTISGDVQTNETVLPADGQTAVETPHVVTSPETGVSE